MTRAEAMARLAQALDPSLLVIACNGLISRQLFGCRDRPSNFYMLGSMGLASSIGLGLALAQPGKEVMVLEGDGNLLMNLGVLASIAASGASNLRHVVFDNGAHESTGGQRTVSAKVPLDRIALAAGYRQAICVDTPEAIPQAFHSLREAAGPAMLLLKIQLGTPPAPDRVAQPPSELTRRFRETVLGGEP